MTVHYRRCAQGYKHQSCSHWLIIPPIDAHIRLERPVRTDKTQASVMGGFVVGIWGSLADTHQGPRLFDITKSNPPEVCGGKGEGCL